MDLTLIEVMPLGEIGEGRLDQFLPLSLVRARLAERYRLDEIDYRTGGPARYVRVAETGGRLGFITPLTHNFCESCNRVRVTCTGTPLVGYAVPVPEMPGSYIAIVVSALLVGFGTRLGSGCTSGHGICGIARLSPRSIIATGVFTAAAIVVVALTHHVFGS
jgi:uncharacterized membrane protein YedE/YeeE